MYISLHKNISIFAKIDLKTKTPSKKHFMIKSVIIYQFLFNLTIEMSRGNMAQMKEEMLNHLKYLCESLETRRVGMHGNLKASNYLKKVYEAMGLKVMLQEVPCKSWSSSIEELTIGRKKLIGAANCFSPSCDITAPFVPLCNLKELEKADLSKKIAVFYGELSSKELVLQEASYQPERDKKIKELLEEKQPAGIIAIYPYFGRNIRVIEEDIGIPSFTVPPETGLILLENLGKNIHMKIESKKTDSVSYNVIARKDNSSQKRIIFVAHYDTKIDTPGAMDNATGTVALLTLASLLLQVELDCNLEFASVTAHEYRTGVHGSEAHVEKIAESSEENLLVINIDGVGQKLGTNSICVGGGSKELKKELEKIVEKYPGIIWVPLWYESDHSPYLWKEIPVVALDSMGIKSLHHHESDSLIWISLQKIEEIVSVVKEIVLAIHDKNSAWMRASKKVS
ncbi:MAG: M28 family peptidase [Candidatus Heimdallarchaeota archaeon]|nr:M28 family peptidase [Candidatus Heimdallarchaeota archaeon]